MMFYYNHSLVSTKDSNSFFTNLKLPPKIEKYLKQAIKEDFKVEVVLTKYSEDSKAQIYLYAKTPAHSVHLANCLISTTEYNCSSLHVANLYSDSIRNKGLGWYLLGLIENWAIMAGYTLLIGNTAGERQNKLIPKFKQNGWLESNIQYPNVRTGNTNIWLYKVIAELQIDVGDENDYDENDDDNEEEEDF